MDSQVSRERTRMKFMLTFTIIPVVEDAELSDALKRAGK